MLQVVGVDSMQTMSMRYSHSSLVEVMGRVGLRADKGSSLSLEAPEEIKLDRTLMRLRT